MKAFIFNVGTYEWLTTKQFKTNWKHEGKCATRISVWEDIYLSYWGQ